MEISWIAIALTSQITRVAPLCSSLSSPSAAAAAAATCGVSTSLSIGLCSTMRTRRPSRMLRALLHRAPLRIHPRELRIVFVFALNCMFVCREMIAIHISAVKHCTAAALAQQIFHWIWQERQQQSALANQPNTLSKQTLFQATNCATSASPVQLESFLDWPASIFPQCSSPSPSSLVRAICEGHICKARRSYGNQPIIISRLAEPADQRPFNNTYIRVLISCLDGNELWTRSHWINSLLS